MSGRRRRPRAPSRAHPALRFTVTLLAVTLVSCGSDKEPACDAKVPALSTQRLTVDGTVLRDVQGREVWLRGVNTGGRSKFPPFFPFAFKESGRPEQANAPDFESALVMYMARVESWGHNVIRLPFSWEAVEPDKGVYDDVFLGRYERMAQVAGQYGLRVIVDFHQDVYARPYCGDGFPLWTCPKPVPEMPTDCAQWFMAYLGDPRFAGYGKAFDRFWANEDGLLDAFEAMWTRVATRLWKTDAVIGFEIINEPAAGTMKEEKWATEVLVPFYEQLGAVIEKAAPGALVFFDSTGLDAATQKPKLTRPKGERMVFAPHFYLAAAFVGGANLGKADVMPGLGRWADLRDGWKVPMVIGEFGIKASNPDAAVYLGKVFDGLDAKRLSGVAWEYSSTVDDWNVEGMSLVDKKGQETAGVKAIVRSYPRAAPGRIDRFEYRPDDHSAVLELTADKAGIIEIAAPRRLYPKGVVGEYDGGPACFVHDGDIVRLRTNHAGPIALSWHPR